MIVQAVDLDAFVARSDELGGPETAACQSYWAGFSYQPDVTVDQTLDPFSEEYVDQQFGLYRELAGRSYQSVQDELLAFDVDRHAAAVNPYDHPSPAGLSLHLERLTRALRLAAIPRNGSVLDMGCGWGLSSEVVAYTGCRVTAVDINPDFVSLVNRRAGRSGLPITAYQSPFEAFSSEQRFDAILFYECFHHAVRPWDVVAQMRRMLAPGGKLVLVGEPINAIWWRNWGLRLDALSIYCIRKFGWFESGWSLDFLLAMFVRYDLMANVVNHPDAEIGTIILASNKSNWKLSATQILLSWPNSGWSLDGTYLIGKSRSSLTISFPKHASGVQLEISNFRGRPISLTIGDGEERREQTVGIAGAVIDVNRNSDVVTLDIDSETWSPATELNNGDIRMISVHLAGAEFY